ncbi:MAG: Na/Pi cotransporter family protein [Lachnospiraceae bacterium]|nr:Na/Pi cotransporter family protein [Lachnospiraceae bacterium]
MTIYDWFIFFGGIGLFLYGMSIMSTGFRNVFGDKLKGILEGATKNRVRAVLVGLLITLIIQSSSATDLMVIGFVNSGMMTLSQAIGVIMGANIGTTVTAQITAFNIGAFAPLFIFIGAVLVLFMKRQSVKGAGNVIMGLGMLFQGISLMKSTIAPLAQTEAFINFLSALSNPFALVLFGIAFTALLQSSSSATVIFQAFAVSGILTYHQSVYLVIGSAIGSVTPNLLASLTANRNGKRTAFLNLIFNLIRAVILLSLISIFPQILTLIQKITPTDIGHQIANTHTLFAIFAVIIMLPFTDWIVKLSQKLIPQKEDEIRRINDRKLQFMTFTSTALPSIALIQARKEIGRMGRIAHENLETALSCFFTPNEEKEQEVLELEETCDYLNREITSKMLELKNLDLSEKDLKQIYYMTLVLADVERISDHAENIGEYASQLRTGKAKLSPQAVEELRRLADATLDSVETCVEIFDLNEYDRIPEAEKKEDLVDDIQDEIVEAHAERLMAGNCDPLGGVIFTDLVTDLERCSDHAINIANSFIYNNNK